MKRSFVTGILLCIAVLANAQSANPNYDKALADSLGANDYGMKAYVLVILKSGSNTSLSKAASDSLFSGHIQNIIRLASEGKLVVSGPMKKNDRAYRGIFILNVAEIEAAKALLAADPAISGNLLEV